MPIPIRITPGEDAHGEAGLRSQLCPGMRSPSEVQRLRSSSSDRAQMIALPMAPSTTGSTSVSPSHSPTSRSSSSGPQGDESDRERLSPGDRHGLSSVGPLLRHAPAEEVEDDAHAACEGEGDGRDPDHERVDADLSGDTRADAGDDAVLRVALQGCAATSDQRSAQALGPRRRIRLRWGAGEGGLSCSHRAACHIWAARATSVSPNPDPDP